MLEDKSAPPGWQKYQFGAEPLFSVLLPVKYEASAEVVEMGGETPTISYTYIAETDTSIYLALLTDNMPVIAERLPDNMKQRFFEGMWRGFVEGMRSEMAKNGMLFKITAGELKKATVSGLEGREQEFTLGPLIGRARMAISGRRAYVAVVLGEADKDAAARARFLNSLEVHAQR